MVTIAAKVIVTPDQLSDPHRFDELRRDKEAFAALSNLKRREDLSHVELCRLAQYLLFQQDADGCLEVLSKARIEDSNLAKGVYLACLGFQERFSDLAAAIRSLSFDSVQPLDIEGYSLQCESVALYYLMHLKDYHQTYAMLYRSETLAGILGLSYRTEVIRAKLEYTANVAGDSFTPSPILSGVKGADGHALRTRFSTLLTSHDIKAVKTLTLAGHLEQPELALAEATKHYALALEGQRSFEQTAHTLSESVPEHYESKLYWALLMLQLFSVIGESAGRSQPERISVILSEAVTQVLHLSPTLSAAARIFPLGVVMAGCLDSRIAPHVNEVITLRSEQRGDGLR